MAKARSAVPIRHPKRDAATATARFVIAAMYALPDQAIRDLLAGDLGDVGKWVARWRVDLPAMQQYAGEIVAFAGKCSQAEREELIHRSLWVTSSVAPSPAPAWLGDLRELDALTPDHLRQSLEDRVDESYRATYLQEQLADDPIVLARISADPLAESQEHFLCRAAEHYEARRQRLEHCAHREGFSAALQASTPALPRHIDWLIRFQLRGESAAEIAKADGRHSDSYGTVTKSILRLAHLIGLRLRPSRPGRPRTGRAPRRRANKK
ncbi:MAG: hypothetical protein ABI818_12040 [Acidobacteriota bacterium]